MSFQTLNFIIGSISIIVLSSLIYFLFFFKENFFIKHKNENKAMLSDSYLQNQIDMIDIEEDDLPFIDTDRSVSLKYNTKRYGRSDQKRTNFKNIIHANYIL